MLISFLQNNYMKTNFFITALILLFIQNNISAQSGYRLTKTFHIKSNGWWDYIVADPQTNKLYVSHGTQVNILDKNTGDSLRVVPNTTGVHGIALVYDLNKGYTSNGRLNNVTVFDLRHQRSSGKLERVKILMRFFMTTILKK